MLQSDGASINVEAELSTSFTDEADEESRDSPVIKTAEKTHIFKDANFVVR